MEKKNLLVNNEHKAINSKIKETRRGNTFDF